MKPLRSAPLTQEDVDIWWNLAPGDSYASDRAFWDAFFDSDRRDAELMLGLTGMACGPDGVCVAQLWAKGCVIYNVAVGARIAIRGYEGQYGDPQDDIMYFA